MIHYVIKLFTHVSDVLIAVLLSTNFSFDVLLVPVKVATLFPPTLKLPTFLELLFFPNSFKTRLICRQKELLNPGLTVMDNFGGVIFQQCCNHVMSISQHAKLSLLKSQAKAR